MKVLVMAVLSMIRNMSEKGLHLCARRKRRESYKGLWKVSYTLKEF